MVVPQIPNTYTQPSCLLDYSKYSHLNSKILNTIPSYLWDTVKYNKFIRKQLVKKFKLKKEKRLLNIKLTKSILKSKIAKRRTRRHGRFVNEKNFISYWKYI